MRELKTTPCGVVTYPSKNTANILTEQAREEHGRKYSKAKDRFQHFREKLALGPPSMSHLEDLAEEGILAQADHKVEKIKSEDDSYEREDWRSDGERDPRSRLHGRLTDARFNHQLYRRYNWEIR